MTREAAAWHEGYISALMDFDVTTTDEQIERATKNPYATTEQKRRLSAHEIFEIRNALRFTLENDSEEWSLQSEIMCVIVERILSRRPERVS